MARSYIKIYGPPILKAIRALEQIAVEMSQKTTIRIYNAFIPYIPTPGGAPWTLFPGLAIPEEEKVKLISKASETLGEYDFFFEWGEEPTKEQVLELISKIDEALEKCGCKYTIVTK